MPCATSLSTTVAVLSTDSQLTTTAVCILSKVPNDELIQILMNVIHLLVKCKVQTLFIDLQN